MNGKALGKSGWCCWLGFGYQLCLDKSLVLNMDQPTGVSIMPLTSEHLQAVLPAPVGTSNKFSVSKLKHQKISCRDKGHVCEKVKSCNPQRQVLCPSDTFDVRHSMAFWTSIRNIGCFYWLINNSQSHLREYSLEEAFFLTKQKVCRLVLAPR